jgi:plastocyanin
MSKGILNKTLFVAGLVLMTSLAHAKDHKLVISNVQFPKDETVKTGDTVTWKNDDLVPHTVTADDGSFKSPTIEAGKEWSYKVTQKKTFSYKCDFHPNMHAKLIIKN